MYIPIIIFPFQVNDLHLVVKSSDGSFVDSQLVEVDNVTSNLRKLYVKAYLGINTDKPPKYWLVFQASVPPMGWNTYFVSKPKGAGENCICLRYSIPVYILLIKL